MRNLTIGKIRGLQQIANQDGVFTICAMDHRGSLRSMINAQDPESVKYEAMVERKIELCSALAKYASAVLLDPIYGAAQCISRSILPKETGLLVAIEATGYVGSKEERVATLLEGWDVEKIKRMGASAVKILVYYRPDLPEIKRKQLDTINRVAGDCTKYDIPFLVEAVSFPVGSEIDNRGEFAARRGELVIDTARDITALPIDVLKAEFPADVRLEYKKDKSELIALCERLSATSPVPWVILSGGVDFDHFYEQVEIACRGGASGFLGGRAIWQEAANTPDAGERVRFLSTVSVDRVKRLAELTTKYGLPWYRKLGLTSEEMTQVSEKWYQEY
ncbi:MAG: tagatose 1,6-diphosphate aldolase [Chloroflexota bacterium]